MAVRRAGKSSARIADCKKKTALTIVNAVRDFIRMKSQAIIKLSKLIRTFPNLEYRRVAALRPVRFLA